MGRGGVGRRGELGFYLGRGLAGVVHFEEAPQGPSSSAGGVGEGGHNPFPFEVEEQRI